MRNKHSSRSYQDRNKVNRVEVEKYRQLPVVQEEMRRQERSRSNEEEEEGSQEDQSGGNVAGNMTKAQMEEVDRKVSEILAQSGGTLPQDDFSPSSGNDSTTDSSDRDSSETRSQSRRHGRKKKVKSGAKVKKREVVRQETWLIKPY